MVGDSLAALGGNGSEFVGQLKMKRSNGLVFDFVLGKQLDLIEKSSLVDLALGRVSQFKRQDLLRTVGFEVIRIPLDVVEDLLDL